MTADALALYMALPPRSRELARYATQRPELPLTTIAMLIRMSAGNMRDRMNKVYSALGVENRGELIAVYGPLLVESASSE